MQAFVEHYDFTFQNTYAMDINLVYEAVAQEEVEVVLAYSTDPRLYEFDLKTLEDDKSFFPPYDASMLVRNETLEKYPEIDEIMKELIGSMDEELVTRLNYEVDINNRSERDVAIEFLQSRDLLSE
ncbi:hypothetical protein NDM98_02685 [Shouchella plakortidis]|uniref:ABC-type glycine betaine transport system substrate-binding domain-containing protein n=1 Tax=Alkalicoccobacillus plakortidis TaxID=444060 RepID=A0ABT0XF52_9BACI|nr:glycine betaine ABC transporter substrate-binding protein [Alkalicoccobacillus plakortidis]MCM2674525.1 hypothetical protein [Alkalicoccobacillus plakortidis]